MKRGMRVAEILAQETTKSRVSDAEDGEVDVRILKGGPGTPTRTPLSTITANAMNSPAVANVKAAMRMQKKAVGSPKRLVTTKVLSTVQMDIKVLDAKGQTVRQEKRVTRTDIVVNDPSGGVKALRRSGAPLMPSHKQHAQAPVKIISIGSSVDESPQYSPDVQGHDGTQARPIVLSNASSTTNGSESSSLKLRPLRRPRRAAARIVISDSEDDEEEGEDDYLPPDSPPPPSAKPRKSLAPPRKSVVPMIKTIPPIPRIPKPSGLKVEVVIPPLVYKPQAKPTEPLPQAPPAPASHPPPKTQSTISVEDTQPHPSSKPKAKPLHTSIGQGLISSRYPYNLIPSPPLKSRTLTPIRRGKGTTAGSSLFAFGRGHAPPSPTTPTDSNFDLSLEFSQLDIGLAQEELETLQLPGKQADYPEYLRPLLEECHQEECGPYEFSAFIESFPLDPILQDARRAAEKRDVGEMLQFRKIGEASYSEVFGIGDVVLKVIPLRDELRHGGVDAGDQEDGPAPTDAKDVRKEIIVTRAMGEVHDRFVKLLKTYVVRGKYPEVLLNLWDEYHEKKGSESVRPGSCCPLQVMPDTETVVDTFTASQLYAIIVLPNGGPDLEAYTFPNPSKIGWRQASSLFWQVAKALAHAEQLVSFEVTSHLVHRHLRFTSKPQHRDLHWGQILVKNLQPSTKSIPLRSITHTLNQSSIRPAASLQRVYMDDLAHGVQATIIDLGLSRMDAGDGGSGERVHWTPFDEEMFMGEGNPHARFSASRY